MFESPSREKHLKMLHRWIFGIKKMILSSLITYMIEDLKYETLRGLFHEKQINKTDFCTDEGMNDFNVEQYFTYIAKKIAIFT